MTFAARQHSSGQLVNLVDRSWVDISISPNDSYAGVRYNSGGNEEFVEGSALLWDDTGNDWLVSGSASDYWIRCTAAATPLGSAKGVWLQLNTTRSWYFAVTGTGTANDTLTIEIATDSGGANIIDSCTVYLEASVEI